MIGYDFVIGAISATTAGPNLGAIGAPLAAFVVGVVGLIIRSLLK